MLLNQWLTGYSSSGIECSLLNFSLWIRGCQIRSRRVQKDEIFELRIYASNIILIVSISDIPRTKARKFWILVGRFSCSLISGIRSDAPI
jgi:hypothetical protein